MALVERTRVAAPCLPIEEVTVESLGGEVFVRGMDMDQFLLWTAAGRDASAPREGETDEQALQRAGIECTSLALAWTVLAADKQPLFTREQWRAWGAVHFPDAMKLYGIAMSLSGRDAEAERKNS